MHRFKDQWLIEPLLRSNSLNREIIEDLAGRDEGEAYLAEKLISSGYLSEEKLASLIKKEFQLAYINLDHISINRLAVEAVPEEICRRYKLFPYEIDAEYISVAMIDPLILQAEEQVAYASGRLVKTSISARSQIESKINEYYNPEHALEDLSDKISSADIQQELQIAQEKEPAEKQQSDGPIIRLTKSLINDAIDKEASDIHIEPTEKHLLIRFRIDGILKKIMEIPGYAAPQLISRIKVISNMDIAETRKPQDGQIKLKRMGTVIDLRISIIPTTYGEKAVIRILDSHKGNVSFEELGINGKNLEKLNTVLTLKHGIVLATGPTGSGKTTTLYAALNRIKSLGTNILTVEDPIEYTIEGINQVQVNEKAGITFSSALRSFLRQDPDVMLVGEIRDRETAEISVQASFTGHLVLSTVHTNSAIETITRLIDLGIDRFKVASALSALIGQRLIRRLCTTCREEVEADEGEKKFISVIQKMQLPLRFFKGIGCPECEYTGYKRRTGIYEILIIDDQIREKIIQGASPAEIEQTAVRNGFKNFTHAAMEISTAGISDIAEISRVLQLNVEEYPPKTLVPLSLKPGNDRNSDTRTDRQLFNPLPAGELADRRKTIMIVDDDKIIRSLISNVLQKENVYKVISACNGIDALEQIEKTSPDLLLLDIMMPGMDGYQLCKHLRQNRKYARLPIIMLTALDGNEDLLKGFRLGVDDYISKPVERQILLARINALLRRSESDQFLI